MKKNVIITISSDKGLCGGINSTSVKISRALHKLNSGKRKIVSVELSFAFWNLI